MLHALVRSGLVLTGLLLLCVGIGNVVAGRPKIQQYDELLSATATAVAADPAALFPPASERQERHELARAKLAFYQRVIIGGQLLSALGIVLLVVGTLRVWVRAPHAPADWPAAN